MSCCHHYDVCDANDPAFTVDSSRITFGPGCINELGARAAALGAKNVALFTDSTLVGGEFVSNAIASVRSAGLECSVFSEVRVEPDDKSFIEASRFASDVAPDLFVSVGGGSVIDTAKAANLYSTYPASLLEYVNAPIGKATPIPGALKPHIACPTTCGTGSECTGIAIFDLKERNVKTGIASRELRPTEALIDPDSLSGLPRNVLACSAFDVLSHAAESYTAKPFNSRAGAGGVARPMSQGANPWSDMGCAQALRLLGEYLPRALTDDTDTEARQQLMWAATLAGIAFGNAGVHLPHAMSYAVAGMVHDYLPKDYPDDHAMVPHGMSVIVNAPAVFRRTAGRLPERHLEIAGLLGANTVGAASADAAELMSGRLLELMRAADMPLGLSELGYHESDASRLADGAWPQQRLLVNAPYAVDEAELQSLFSSAMHY